MCEKNLTREDLDRSRWVDTKRLTATVDRLCRSISTTSIVLALEAFPRQQQYRTQTDFQQDMLCRQTPKDTLEELILFGWQDKSSM